MADSSTHPGAPRWVKVLGIIALGLILLFIILEVSGIRGDQQHGPGRHGPMGADAPPALVDTHGAPQPSRDFLLAESGRV